MKELSGLESRCGSKDGKDLSSSSSSKVSTISVPTTDGGFGCGFKGWIDEKAFTAAKLGRGMVMVVKRLNQEGFQGHKERLAEISYLGQLHHPNLVKSIGYCLEDDHRLLVYEFMPKGSLEHHLFKKGSYFQLLPWSIRMKVAL